MAFAITANFLLGTYQGSDSGGRPEPYPSPDRLYKACVAAAYNTFDFERQTDDRVLTDEQIKNALAWLEDNPPHSIHLELHLYFHYRKKNMAYYYQDHHSFLFFLHLN